MHRRGFLCASIAAFATPPAARAQQKSRTYRVGVLDLVGEAANAANLTAFRQGLRQLGYVEGQNLVIDYRSADGQTERFPDLASELVRLGIDVIVTRGTPAALAAKRATGTIPIVMASSGDPAAEGIVTSLARPGGNVTGFHMMAAPQIAARRLEFLKGMVPASSRVGVLWNPATHYTPLLMRETEKAARAMGVRLHGFEMQGPEGLDRTFDAMLVSQIDAFVTMEDTLTLTHRARIVEFAAMSRLPAVHGLREFVEAGGLVAYGTDRQDLFRRSAAFVHKTVSGTSPASLPGAPPTQFELVLNLKTAKALGLTIPPSLLLRADQVIE